MPREVMKEVIIVKKSVEESIDDEARNAIKIIMRTVDNSNVGDREHAVIRSVILDCINDMSRNYKIILERVLNKVAEPD